MKGILVIHIGSVDADILKSITNALEKTFHIKVESGKEMAILQESYNLKRRQYHSSTILKKIQGAKPKNFDLMLCVTDADLYVPDLNFVFGEADISSGMAIISLARLRQEFYGLRPDEKLFQKRAIKEAIHHPDVLDRIKKIGGSVIDYKSPEELKRVMTVDLKTFSEVAAKIGLRK